MNRKILSTADWHLGFQHQTALVTGGASGLGKAVIHKLLSLGVQVACLDKNPIEEKEFKDQLTGQMYSVDIRQEEEVKGVVEKVFQHFGHIDILINSAGITGITQLKSHETQTDDIQKVMDINFMGSYYTSKHVLPLMLKQQYGRILHIASIAGKEGNAGMLAYSASKAAVIGMTKVQGKEYAETGITINALAPAVIRTAMVDALPVEQVKYMTDKIPMKRCGSLEEAANLIAYIVSPWNSFTTGFTFDLSGGRATY